MRGHLRFFLALPIAAALVLAPPGAARADDPKAEAGVHFDHGLALADEGNVGAALLEFQKAYELQHHPAVLYNIGTAYAVLGKPVEAADALTRYLSESGTALDPKRRVEVRTEIARQMRRVGFVFIRTTPPGATVRVDGIEAGKTPLEQPVAVATGIHLLDAEMAGHQRAERKVAVAGEERVTVNLELAAIAEAQPPSAGAIGLDCEVQDVTVRIDDRALDRISFPAAIPAAPGEHRLEFRRDGYDPIAKAVVVPEGGSGRVSCGLRPVRDLPPESSAILSFRVSEPDAEVRIDGQVAAATSTLPVGMHHVEIRRAGFFTWSRDIALEVGHRQSFDVSLAPTPDYAHAYRQRAGAQRTWALALGSAGAATAITAGALYLWNNGRYADWTNERGSLDAAWGAGPPYAQTLTDRQNAADEQIRSIQRTDKVTIALGAGALALVAAGVALFLTGDDPKRYDGAPSRGAAGYAPGTFAW